MRKLLCFVLTLAMVLSMVPSVFAASLPEDATYKQIIEDGNPPALGSGVTTTSGVKGTAGKKADDLGFTVSGTGYASALGVPSVANIEVNEDGTIKTDRGYDYFVFEFSVKPKKESGNGSGFKYADNNGETHVQTVPYTNLKQNEWNRVMIYFDYTQIETKYITEHWETLLRDSALTNDWTQAATSSVPESDGTYYKKEAYTEDIIKRICPSGHIFINGARYDTVRYNNRLRDVLGISYFHYTAADNDDMTSSIRHQNGRIVKFYPNGEASLTFDDVAVYYTNTAPDAAAATALPVIVAGDGYTVSGSEIKAAKEIPLAELKAANPAYEIEAYEDSTYSTELADNVILYPGNVVVSKNPANNCVVAYSISGTTSLARKILYENNGTKQLTRQGANNASPGNNKTFAEANYDGYYGKEYSDKAFNLFYTDTGIAQRIYFNASEANVATIASDGTHTYNYYVFETEFRGNTGHNTSIVFRGPNDVDISPELDYRKYFPYNEWSKIAVVADFSNVDTTYMAEELLAESEALGAAGEYQKMGSTIENFDITKAAPAIKTYVNGELVGVKYADRLQDRFGMYNTYFDGTTLKPNVSGADFRLAHIEGGYSIYDNAVFYQTNIAPDGVAITKLPEIGGGTVVAEGLSAYKSTAKVTTYGQAPLTAANIEKANKRYAITAYTDKSLNETVSRDTVLTADNYILAKDKFTGTPKVFKAAPLTQSDSNYMLKDAVTITNKAPVYNESTGKWESSGSGKAGRFTLTNAMTATAEKGVKGKASDDTSIKFEWNMVSNPFIGNGALSAVDSNNNVIYDYYVLKFNVMPKDDSTFSFSGPNGGTICNGINSKYLKNNEWNSVLIYVDYSDIDLTHFTEELLAESNALAQAGKKQVIGSTITDEDFDKTKVAPAGYVFVNGVQIGGAAYPDRIQDIYGLPGQYYHPTDKQLKNRDGMDFRLALPASESAMYIDDLYIYQTNIRPDGITLTTLPEITATSDKATLVDNRLTIKSGAALSDLTTNADSVVAYDAEAKAADFASGTLLSLVSENNAVNAYKVSGFDVAENVATATDVLAGDTIIIAEYDSNDNLVNCAMNIAAADGDVEVTYTPTNAANAVRAYLLDDMATIKPLSTPIVVQ